MDTVHRQTVRFSTVIRVNVEHFAYKTFRLLDTSPTTWTLRLLDITPTGQFAYWTLRLLRGQFAHSIVIRPTVWPQYTNVTDRTDRQRTDSIGRTVLQTVNQKSRPPNLC